MARTGALVTLALSGALLASCGSDREPEPTPTAPPTATPTVPLGELTSFTLTCPTPVGEITSPLRFAVSQDPATVEPSDEISYRISVPYEPVESPVSATFLSSEVRFAIPDGLEVDGVATDPPDVAPFTSVTTDVTDTAIVVRSEGEFPVETRVTASALVIDGTITAQSDSEVQWQTPTLVRSTVRAPLLGEITTDCEVEDPGAIAVTEVG